MEKETTKLLNVLRRIARAAGHTAGVRATPEAASFCVAQYNKILARLTELEPSLQPLFTPLPSDSSLEVIRIAARELLAYFEVDEPDFAWAFGGRFGRGCRPHRARVRCIPIAPGC
jgi:hypothetical protein